MKTSIRFAFAAFLVAALALLPAFAQDAMGTLHVNGTVMTSTGGEFVPAASGQGISEGTRLMVAEDSSASVTFSNGAVVNFTQPGVYTINAPVGLAAGTTYSAGSVIASNAAFITFAAVIAAAGVASSTMDDDEDLLEGTPVSR